MPMGIIKLQDSKYPNVPAKNVQPVLNKFFKKLGFAPCKAKQTLRGMDLLEKKHKKIKAHRKPV